MPITFHNQKDACTKPGEIGALLRREGLYASHLSGLEATERGGLAERPGPEEAGPAGQTREPAFSSGRGTGAGNPATEGAARLMRRSGLTAPFGVAD